MAGYWNGLQIDGAPFYPKNRMTHLNSSSQSSILYIFHNLKRVGKELIHCTDILPFLHFVHLFFTSLLFHVKHQIELDTEKHFKWSFVGLDLIVLFLYYVCFVLYTFTLSGYIAAEYLNVFRCFIPDFPCCFFVMFFFL